MVPFVLGPRLKRTNNCPGRQHAREWMDWPLDAAKTMVCAPSTHSVRLRLLRAGTGFVPPETNARKAPPRHCPPAETGKPLEKIAKNGRKSGSIRERYPRSRDRGHGRGGRQKHCSKTTNHSHPTMERELYRFRCGGDLPLERPRLGAGGAGAVPSLRSAGAQILIPGKSSAELGSPSSKVKMANYCAAVAMDGCALSS
jgi:hypothetical protein